MSFILRCDAPGCTEKAISAGSLPAGWVMSHNQNGWLVHAHAATHLAAASATTGNPAAVAVT